MPFSRLYSSALRHVFQALAGQRDEDHLAQAIWNLTALIHFEETGRVDLDDVACGSCACGVRSPHAHAPVTAPGPDGFSS